VRFTDPTGHQPPEGDDEVDVITCAAPDVHVITLDEIHIVGDPDYEINRSPAFEVEGRSGTPESYRVMIRQLEMQMHMAEGGGLRDVTSPFPSSELGNLRFYYDIFRTELFRTWYYDGVRGVMDRYGIEGMQQIVVWLVPESREEMRSLAFGAIALFSRDPMLGGTVHEPYAVGSGEAAEGSSGAVIREEAPPRRPVEPAIPRVAAMSDAALLARVRRLHRSLIEADLRARGREVTEEAIGAEMRYSTLSIVEIETAGGTTRIVTTNSVRIHRALEANPGLLEAGEVAGSRPVTVYGPTRGQRQTVHAEQLGMNDAHVTYGVDEGRVATSNNGCQGLCIPLIDEFFAGFRHVNPAAH
jgi:hypothetical protein